MNWYIPISQQGKAHTQRIAHLIDFMRGETVCGKLINPAFLQRKRAVNRFCAQCRKRQGNVC